MQKRLVEVKEEEEPGLAMAEVSCSGRKEMSLEK